MRPAGARVSLNAAIRWVRPSDGLPTGYLQTRLRRDWPDQTDPHPDMCGNQWLTPWATLYRLSEAVLKRTDFPNGVASSPPLSRARRAYFSRDCGTVSQNCILRNVRMCYAPRHSERPADCKSAIQQTASLRYAPRGGVRRSYRVTYEG